ncbi:prepilin-type N-terminal cleavage/methylation domain-containing protein [uncultured Ramlibacter sp.]|uniref:prepilin-type N-terminal cleavage/methylation domain-containing protein n=1 Tax=uncultured Ramlibacter sp. TaxID=260755 RepID=UPI0026325B74|nr:prepilin-type N-terminal cleavage/methylation domain-containing protein [uncultured Ramlibacter sp.]
MLTPLRQPPRKPSAGFTLIEVMGVVAIVAALAVVAVPVYRDYVQRAQLAQLLSQIDQIATSVQVEDATGERNLQRDAKPGKAPPQLQVVADAAFSEPGGIRLLLIRAPAGFFASSPQTARYGLIADLTPPADERRLRELARALPYNAGDKLWLASGQLAFPLVDGAAPGAASARPATGWEGAATLDGTGGWTCQGTVSVYGSDGQLLTGVNAGVRIQVTLSVTGWDGKPFERNWTDQGNLAGGKASFSLRGLSAQAGRGEVVTGCKLAVSEVVYYYPTNPPVQWDGGKPTLQINKPPTP